MSPPVASLVGHQEVGGDTPSRPPCSEMFVDSCFVSLPFVLAVIRASWASVSLSVQWEITVPSSQIEMRMKWNPDLHHGGARN